MGARNDAGVMMPVLLHTSVLHLKTLVFRHEGPPPDTFELVSEGPQQLLHEAAPVAVYVWPLLRFVHGICTIRLDMVPKMSTRRCCISRGDPIGHDGFNFMANFKAPSAYRNSKSWTPID